ncbi:glnS [Symbiodinium natans]|uniref:GlnS protein n=1 Tax=Symbiodinium natans TaxID=878477 RepID=A0A812R254_9DINO|nr:glnS [Symbiodinium natans]
MATAFAVPRPSLLDLKALPAQASCRKSSCQCSHELPTEHARRIGVAATALYVLQRRTKVARQARSREEAISAAVNIARDTTRRGRGRMSMQERKRLRAMEVQRKIQVLKGRRPVSRKTGAEASSEPDDEAGEEEGSGGSSSSSAPSEVGEGQEEWAFKREYKTSSVEQSLFEVSDDARAIAETELFGQGGVATSQQLLDAGREFMFAKDFEKAADLLELVSERISKEQLNRKLDYKKAQAIDDEATEMLATVYSDSGRLTLAFNTYDVLRTRVADREARERAEVGWIQTAVRIAESLQKEQRFDQCLELLLTVRELAQSRVAGTKLKEEIEMTIAICLHKQGKKEEALEILREVRRNSMSRERKAQAQFVMDVISVDDIPLERNEEFHKVWDDNFKLPKDTMQSLPTARKGSALNLNLSDQEREFRDWAGKYWEERLKSPAYYAMLTLWVTWPFAIPVVSLMRRSGLLEY